MGRAVIVAPDQRESTDFPTLSGVQAQGEIRTRAVVAGADRPILLWEHELAAGASIRFAAAPVDHLMYLTDGEIAADGEAMSGEGCLVVEHGGAATLTAGAASTVLHFTTSEGAGPRPRTGGSVHVVSGEAVPRGHDAIGLGHALFMDADCPRCELWLHQTVFGPEHTVGRHYHTEDELIVVTSGSMMLGRRELPVGSALAIDREVPYAFRSGPAGLSFINFRPARPYAVTEERPTPVDEQAYIRDAIAAG